MENIYYINWWEATRENGLEDVKSTFLSLFSQADYIPSIYHSILYRFLENHQMKHWSEDLFVFTRKKSAKLKELLAKKLRE